MCSRELRTIPKANLMLLFFASVTERTSSYTEKEKALLVDLKKHAYSAMGVYCSSFDNARRLVSSFIDSNCPLRGQLEAAYPIISYPVMMPSHLQYIYARGEFMLGVVQEFVHPNVPRRGMLKEPKYYFVFDLQPLGYKELLNKISGASSD